MRQLMMVILAAVPTLGLAAPGLAMTEISPVEQPQTRFEIVEQMHEQGYATVLGVKQHQGLILVDTVDEAGPLTAVLNPNSGQIVQSYRTTATSLDPVELTPVMELSSQRSVPDLQIRLEQDAPEGPQRILEAETITPSGLRYGDPREAYVNLTLARF